ncbi:hypothetical protein HYPSUDRAFT_914018 [Hypholoma sublateritium FD-334 SS-4]|uniref:Uncharacterized protein n=1 Tax=Hypholoma sublateritium (strain FD-334 SS-4) TaxID=945553 RepID=A0A0D2KVY2_HYPSF|nr:hypothetical protein HYPSUDRAFT_914018 [Hypholoma sublateritium FD-334 SS-4]
MEAGCAQTGWAASVDPFTPPISSASAVATIASPASKIKNRRRDNTKYYQRKHELPGYSVPLDGVFSEPISTTTSASMKKMSLQAHTIRQSLVPVIGPSTTPPLCISPHFSSLNLISALQKTSRKLLSHSLAIETFFRLKRAPHASLSHSRLLCSTPETAVLNVQIAIASHHATYLQRMYPQRHHIERLRLVIVSMFPSRDDRDSHGPQMPLHPVGHT